MSSESHLHRAMSYRDEQRFDEALAEIECAIQERKGFESPLLILAHTQDASGQRPAAIATLKRLFRSQQERAVETALYLARLHWLSDDLAAAVSWARAAVSLDPEDAYSRSMLACHLLNVEDYAGAKAQGQEAVRLQPDSAANYLNLAVACEELGEFSLAISAYRSLLSLDPADTDAQKELERLVGCPPPSGISAAAE